MAPKNTCYNDGSTPRVCIIGAGLSGLCSGIQLKRQLGLSTFTIFDKNHDVGGVWLTNCYPGCQTEAFGHLYSYSFAQNPGWAATFALRSEMWEYIHNVAKTYELYSHIQFNTLITSVIWNDVAKIWKVCTKTGELGQPEKSMEFDIVILGTGPFHSPNYPEQFQAFKGPLVHSAEWNGNIKLENQVVGVIGSGASAGQIIPTIARKTRQLVVYQRTPAYVIPLPRLQISRLTHLVYTIFPFVLWLLRSIMFMLSELLGISLKSENMLNTFGQKLCLMWMRWNIDDKQLAKHFVPDYKFGCNKVPIHANTFHKAFNLPNVKLNTSRISEIVDQTITTEDGQSQTLDVLILCTGFKTQEYFAPVQVFGKNGVDVLELWKSDRPKTYYGIACNDAPNLFFILGPNSMSHTTATFTMECQLNLIVQILREMMARNACSIQLKLSAQIECMAEITNKMSKTLIATAKHSHYSWFEDDTIMWPKSATNYWRKTRTLDASKFEFRLRNDEADLDSKPKERYCTVECF